jgi:hypothetical protein
MQNSQHSNETLALSAEVTDSLLTAVLAQPSPVLVDDTAAFSLLEVLAILSDSPLTEPETAGRIFPIADKLSKALLRSTADGAVRSVTARSMTLAVANSSAEFPITSMYSSIPSPVSSPHESPPPFLLSQQHDVTSS